MNLMKTHFLARIGENLGKRCFKAKVEQNIVFKKGNVLHVDLHFLDKISTTLTKHCF